MCWFLPHAPNVNVVGMTSWSAIGGRKSFLFLYFEGVPGLNIEIGGGGGATKCDAYQIIRGEPFLFALTGMRTSGETKFLCVKFV